MIRPHVLAVVLVFGLAGPEGSAIGQTPIGTAFTYQGKLENNGLPASGPHDFIFRLYDAATNGTQIGLDVALGAVPVTGGLLTVRLDFGTGAFDQDEARWLAIVVRPTGSPGSYIALPPRQELTPTPYSRRAQLAGSADVAADLALPFAAAFDAAGNPVFSITNTNPSLGSGGAYFKSIGGQTSAVLAESPNGGTAGHFITGADIGFPIGSQVGVLAKATGGSAKAGWFLTDSAGGIAIQGEAINPATKAAWFIGDVDVAGHLAKGSGSFKIDHPLDPTNKYLQHSFVESPDMMNVYNGNVVTDTKGYAEIHFPDWFEALNKDFRYQLTAVGQFAQAIVSREIVDNRFTIKTDRPGVKVSWQVTGIRKDPYAEKNRMPVELDKPEHERGKYLYPQVYGKSSELIGGLAHTNKTVTKR